MNKSALKSFAIQARKKLIGEMTYKAGLVGITRAGIAKPVHESAGIQMFDIGAQEPYAITGEQVKQRRSLADRVKEKGFDQVIEEAAYTWFNRIIAIRFMEVNDYLPTRIRVLSSETRGKQEPDLVTEAPDVQLGFTAEEVDAILQMKQDNRPDELFRLLFIRQCNALNELLPDLFQPTSDYSELLLSISYTNEDSVVRLLVDGIGEEDFKDQVEILGWMYQYYNSELKDETFALLKKNVKIAKERIPAATQLFTPDWIVRYMVENSLGRLWLEGHPDPALKNRWTYYLDDVEQESTVESELEPVKEAAKRLRPEDIRVMDPCMGSGHILVYAFDVLMDIYRSCGYSERDAAKLILKHNLVGLDIDDRAGQLASFALLMKARGYARRILQEGIKPRLLSIQESGVLPDELIAYIGKGEPELAADLASIIDSFRNAKEFGSILQIRPVDYDRLHARLDAIRDERHDDLFLDVSYKQEITDLLLPLLEQAKLLSGKYHVVVTNPPYMGSSGMGRTLSEFVKANYPASKADLFAVFMERCAQLLQENGYQAMITQHAWMFLSSYEQLRERFLARDMVHMAHLGPRAFEEIGGEVVQTTAFVVRSSYTPGYKTVYVRLTEADTAKAKEEQYLSGGSRYTAQNRRFAKIPGSPLAYWVSDKVLDIFGSNKNVADYGKPCKGIDTGDNKTFLRYWHEVRKSRIHFPTRDKQHAYVDQAKWYPYNKGGSFRKWYGNLEVVVNWEHNGQALRSFKGSNLRNKDYYLQQGITWSTVSTGKLSLRRFWYGHLFDNGGCCFFADNDDDLDILLAVLNSSVTGHLCSLSPTLNYQPGDIGRLPVADISTDARTRIRELALANISIAKTDWDSFEASWDFMRHPFLLHKGSTLEESYANWKELTELQFARMKENEEELNRLFIRLYGLEDELSPEVGDHEVSVRRADVARDVKSFLSYAVGCMFGRYSLDTDGVVYAGDGWDGANGGSFAPDPDNVVLITDEDYFDDDMVGRLEEFLKAAYGAEQVERNLDFIAGSLGIRGKTSREIIRSYFLKDFYKDHVRMYQKTPIYWLFDSGGENGFKALIYMHRYHPDTAGMVRTDYLHRVQKALEGAAARADHALEHAESAAQKAQAVKDKEKLVKQLAETKTYDAALAHIAAQRIGIDPDDGVTANYAKFQGVEAGVEGKRTSRIDLLAKLG